MYKRYKQSSLLRSFEQGGVFLFKGRVGGLAQSLETAIFSDRLGFWTRILYDLLCLSRYYPIVIFITVMSMLQFLQLLLLLVVLFPPFLNQNQSVHYQLVVHQPLSPTASAASRAAILSAQAVHRPRRSPVHHVNPHLAVTKTWAQELLGLGWNSMEIICFHWLLGQLNCDSPACFEQHPRLTAPVIRIKRTSQAGDHGGGPV